MCTTEIRAFADFSSDQDQDVVALLAALSTKLAGAGQTYQGADQDSARQIDQYLTGSVYVPPRQR